MFLLIAQDDELDVGQIYRTRPERTQRRPFPSTLFRDRCESCDLISLYWREIALRLGWARRCTQFFQLSETLHSVLFLKSQCWFYSSSWTLMVL